MVLDLHRIPTPDPFIKVSPPCGWPGTPGHRDRLAINCLSPLGTADTHEEFPQRCRFRPPRSAATCEGPHAKTSPRPMDRFMPPLVTGTPGRVPPRRGGRPSRGMERAPGACTSSSPSPSGPIMGPSASFYDMTGRTATPWAGGLPARPHPDAARATLPIPEPREPREGEPRPVPMIPSRPSKRSCPGHGSRLRMAAA